MNDSTGQWLWFLDDDLVHTFLNVEPENPQLVRRAASHPAVVRAMRLWLQASPDEALAELEPAIADGNADALLVAGQIEFERSHFEEAAARYRVLSERFPDHPFASLNLGLCSARLRQWAGAVDSLQRAVLLNPERAEAWQSLGVSLLHQRRTAEARSAFAQTLKLRPEYAPAWLGQAAALQLESKHAEALAIYERMLEAQPGREEILTNALAAAMDLRDHAKARALANRLLQLKPHSQPALLALASAATDDEDFVGAAQWWTRLTETAPDSFEDWFNLGVCHQRMWQSEKAAEAFERAHNLKPDDGEALEGLAQTLRELEDHERTVAAWRKLVHLEPGRDDLRFQAGLVFHDSGLPREAALEFEECTRRKPTWRDAWINLAASCVASGDKDGATRAFETVLKLDPANAAARRSLVVLAIERQDLVTALALRDKLPPGDYEIAYNLAYLLQTQGRLSEAAALYREVLASRRDWAEAQLNLGNVLFALGRPEESKPLWKAALEVRPELARHFLASAHAVG